MFKVETDSKKLVEHTMKMTNTKRFPKKVRYSFTQRLVDSSIAIYENVVRANSTYPQDEESKKLRYSFQKEAMIQCKLLLFLIEIAFKNGYISISSMEHWSGLVATVIKGLNGWIKSAKK